MVTHRESATMPEARLNQLSATDRYLLAAKHANYVLLLAGGYRGADRMSCTIAGQ
jgi:hypothetical protein